MTPIAQRHEDFYQQLVAELTEREGRCLTVASAEAANDPRFHTSTGSRRRLGATVAIVLACVSAIGLGSSPLAVGGALALMAVLAAPLLAIERGSVWLLALALAGGAVGVAAAYGLAVTAGTASVAGLGLGLALLFHRTAGRG